MHAFIHVLAYRATYECCINEIVKSILSFLSSMSRSFCVSKFKPWSFCRQFEKTGTCVAVFKRSSRKCFTAVEHLKNC